MRPFIGVTIIFAMTIFGNIASGSTDLETVSEGDEIRFETKTKSYLLECLSAIKWSPACLLAGESTPGLLEHIDIEPSSHARIQKISRYIEPRAGGPGTGGYRMYVQVADCEVKCERIIYFSTHAWSSESSRVILARVRNTNALTVIRSARGQ